jgi:LmbE family N-acetylglucosaminyl deacetylase
MLNSKKPGISPWLILGSVAVTGSLAYRKLMGNFRTANPDIAIRHGRNITRGAKRVMAVTAHHDDLEFLAAGTLRLLSLAGSQITVIVATGGEKQQNGRSNSEEIRNQEQRDAGNIIGYNQVRFLHLSDMGLGYNPLFQKLLEKEWDQIQPEIVFTMDPSYTLPFIMHPDHLAVGRVVLNLARSKKAAQTTVLFYGSRQPNVIVDIKDVIEDKIESVLAHKSQLKTWQCCYRVFIRAYDRIIGMQPSIPYGENFRSLSLPELDKQVYIENWSSQEPEQAPGP